LRQPFPIRLAPECCARVCLPTQLTRGKEHREKDFGKTARKNVKGEERRTKS
jgi:hypothetical protein